MRFEDFPRVPWLLVRPFPRHHVPALTAEDRFKFNVETLLRWDVYPGAKSIRILQDWDGMISGPRPHRRRSQRHNLNGRECAWRDAVLEPWMAAHPDHPITTKRRRLSVG